MYISTVFFTFIIVISCNPLPTFNIEGDNIEWKAIGPCIIPADPWIKNNIQLFDTSSNGTFDFSLNFCEAKFSVSRLSSSQTNVAIKALRPIDANELFNSIQKFISASFFLGLLIGVLSTAVIGCCFCCCVTRYFSYY